MKRIHIVLTMDCEPTTGTTHPLATGPANWTMGENAVRGYSEVAAQYRLPVSYFIHPETAIAQAAMFRELEQDGACLGLHMHPGNIQDGATRALNITLITAGFRRPSKLPCLLNHRHSGRRPSAIIRPISALAPSRQMTPFSEFSTVSTSRAALVQLRGGSFLKCVPCGLARSLIPTAQTRYFVKLLAISISSICLCQRIFPSFWTARPGAICMRIFAPM